MRVIQISVIALLCATGCNANKEAVAIASNSSALTLVQYTQQCETALGPLPAIDCAAAGTTEEVVLTKTPSRMEGGQWVPDGPPVNVTTTAQLEDGRNCDRPFLLGLGANLAAGQRTSCVPKSRVGVTGNGRDNTVFVYICRAYYFRAAGSERFDDLGLIGYNSRTGDTCFWASRINGHRPGTVGGPPDLSFDGTNVPRPGSPADVQFWPAGTEGGRNFWRDFNQLARTGECLKCHDSDPIIHSPPLRTMTLALPSFPESPYRILARADLNAAIGGASTEWNTPRQINSNRLTDAQARCLGCHRIGERNTCRRFMKDAAGIEKITTTDRLFTSSHPRMRWMDQFDYTRQTRNAAQWTAHFNASVDAIQDCCNNPATPNCWAPIPVAALAVPRGCCMFSEGSPAYVPVSECAGPNYLTDDRFCADAPPRVCCEYVDPDYPVGIYHATLNTDQCMAMDGNSVDASICGEAERTICCQYYSGDPPSVTYQYLSNETCQQQLSGTETSPPCGDAEVICCSYVNASGDTVYSYLDVKTCIEDLEGSAASDFICQAARESVCCQFADGSSGMVSREFCQEPDLEVDPTLCGEGSWEANAIAFRGQVGRRATYACPPFGTPYWVWGTDVYTDDSSVCTAAVHVGLITLLDGGTVTIEMLDGQSSYQGTLRYGIQTYDWDSWPASYRFIVP
jgi:hypothetical protein